MPVEDLVALNDSIPLFQWDFVPREINIGLLGLFDLYFWNHGWRFEKENKKINP